MLIGIYKQTLSLIACDPQFASVLYFHKLIKEKKHKNVARTKKMWQKCIRLSKKCNMLYKIITIEKINYNAI